MTTGVSLDSSQGSVAPPVFATPPPTSRPPHYKARRRLVGRAISLSDRHELSGQGASPCPIPNQERVLLSRGGVQIETYIDGDGPSLIILPSYGRDGGVDYDRFTTLVAQVGWKVLRPQPRGVGRSKGPMTGLTMSDLADDVALVIRSLGAGRPAVLLGHAFGNMLARIVAGDHPESVSAVVLAAAEASEVALEVVRTSFIAGDPTAPAADRLAALRQAFFAPGHDPAGWLDGWYPETLAMQRASVKASSMADYWGCGTVPLLEIIPAADPFKPRPYWRELRDQFPDRVTTEVIDDAAHALFPEHPDKVAAAVISWLAVIANKASTHPTK